MEPSQNIIQLFYYPLCPISVYHQLKGQIVKQIMKISSKQEAFITFGLVGTLPLPCALFLAFRSGISSLVASLEVKSNKSGKSV